jgi:hypothetical protein
MLAGAMGATIKNAFSLHAVTNDPAATMGAGRCQSMDRTFETIEDVRLPSDPHFKALIVHVPAYFASLGIPLLIH